MCCQVSLITLKDTSLYEYFCALKISVFIFIAFLQHRQHSIPQEYKALYHLHSVIDMHKVSKQEISFTPVTLIHAQVGFFASLLLFTFQA
jgi:hypothetical protein